jgi:cation diffusion facilitator CzcD-associated flavoprotein CzcO
MSTSDLPARETMEFDVVIIGAGPAGLAAAIRLKQLAPERSVVVVEKDQRSERTFSPARLSTRSPSINCCPIGATIRRTHSSSQ